jgi:hypothetical protein
MFLEPPMKKTLVLATFVLSACSTATPPQSGTRSTAPTQAAAPAQTGIYTRASSPQPERATPEEIGLNELSAVTFSCSKAGLNAAAHEAAKATGRGRYQFSYFKIVSSSHHSIYEVHFKSNNYEDPELKYCVSVYCQQGWNPLTGNPVVRSMGESARSTAGAGGATAASECDEHQHQPPAKSQTRSKPSKPRRSGS